MNADPPGYCNQGLGIGVGFQTGVLVVQNNLPIEWIPVGTAAVQFFQSMGGAIFIAVAQAVFQNGLTEGIEKNVPGVPPQIFINSGASQIDEVLQSFGATQYKTEVLLAYLTGLRDSYYITVACAAAAFLTACGLRWKKIQKRGGPVIGEAAAEIGEATESGQSAKAGEVKA
ncbi:hypothetical protein VTK26DRAFT_1034 [Humicola hyalothermophila]